MGAVCQCQCQQDQSNTQNELKFGEQDAHRNVRMVIATERFESEEQSYLDQVDQVWYQYDTRNTGKLNQREALEFLKVILKEQTGNEPDEQYLRTNFKMLEDSQANLIEKEEALEYLRGYRLGTELRKMVSRPDTEGYTEDTPLSTM